MATLLWQRDLSSDVDDVKDTFSSWDTCMTKAYCKWPVIVAIIVGSLIVLSLVWCIARCLCCGAECCCGCLSCCNTCCPSPRRGRKRDNEYEQPPPPPPPHQFQPYPQYQSAAPPQYGGFASGGGYRGAQTATFDVPSKTAPVGKYNEDALPAMPSWDTAASRHVEEEDVEMEKLDHPQAQRQSLLPSHDSTDRHYGQQQHQQEAAGDLGPMYAGGPYQDYNGHQQYTAPPARNSAYAPTYRTDYTSPTSTVYEPPTQQWGQRGYAPSVPPSIMNSAPQHTGVNRKPVQGTWRDV